MRPIYPSDTVAAFEFVTGRKVCDMNADESRALDKAAQNVADKINHLVETYNGNTNDIIHHMIGLLVQNEHERITQFA